MTIEQIKERLEQLRSNTPIIAGMKHEYEIIEERQWVNLYIENEHYSYTISAEKNLLSGYAMRYDHLTFNFPEGEFNEETWTKIINEIISFEEEI
ncbi:hypothetical protein H1S01_12725 [Heliobacterium chlorum]|uniref:Uncharacterized protein n=1 Tax=Heliobacterium chlorum TaxID=2698 RepID=A0ABR7T3L9_HELCL|nr:hypothetical protein [Heliobacterium chlorum]MBC9785372.1 hypothetical protein [Heliobacterium chlorum]